ncbi:MAG: rhodanese-like domain-containing protein [Bacteroidales bacterium]|nr:rhodanese-like domain-containing protein [Bacteroidales bacterium]
MKKSIIMGILSAFLALAGCKASAGEGAYQSVDVKKFTEVIGDTGVVRLDVRTAEEYAEGHIEGAINIDVMADGFEQKAVATLPQEKTVALYCRSGRRSKRAADILSAKGYKVVELDTGYLGWTGEGCPVVK